MSQTDVPKLAHSIGELADRGPVRRSTLYNEIAAGRLRARKIGRRTVVLDEDWRAFLAGAPVIAPIKVPAAIIDNVAPNPRSRGKPHKSPVAPPTQPVEALTAAGTANTTGTQASHAPGKTGARS
jgi:hypothetical protein